jgi:uncharacterized repeat protein (TIGR01451 family)
MKSLNYIKSIGLKTKVFILSLLAFALFTGVVLAGFGPNRPVFDWNNPDQRQGSLTGPVFNSFINTPVYGDERAFLDAKDASITQAGGFQDQVPVTPGNEYLVRMYVHNNANQSTNADGTGIARNTRVRIHMHEGLANGHGITGYISADNATPAQVWDTVDFRNESTAFAVEYVPGSARIQNSVYPQGISLPDAIVSGQGVQIGHDQMNGNMPGCFEYAAYVTIRVRVSAPDVTFEKQVRPAGTDAYSNLAAVNPGDRLQWLITTQNNGTLPLEDIFISDQMPPHMELVPGSVRWIYTGVDGSTQDVVQGDQPLFTTGGIDFSDYTVAQNGGFYLRFDTIAQGNFEECEVTVRNIAFLRSNQNAGEREDYADVRITREDCDEPTPVYSCDLLTAEHVSGRTYRFTTAATARNGAEIQQYVYTFGDDSNQLVTDKDEVEHTYAEPGRYVASVVVRVNVNGQQEQVEGERCVATVNVEVPPAPAPQPTVPSTLPVTGMGSLIGIFTSVSIIGGVAHSLIIGRRQ